MEIAKEYFVNKIYRRISTGKWYGSGAMSMNDTKAEIADGLGDGLDTVWSGESLGVSQALLYNNAEGRNCLIPEVFDEIHIIPLLLEEEEEEDEQEEEEEEERMPKIRRSMC